MLDPTGHVITDTRDDSVVDGLVHGNVRGWETPPGGAAGPGRFVPHVVIQCLTTVRDKNVPVQHLTLSIKSYGSDAENAWAIYGAVSDVWHGRDPHVYDDGMGFYISFDESGGSAEADPATKQPYVEFIATLDATTQAVAA